MPISCKPRQRKQPQSDMRPILLDEHEAAAYLNISEQYLRADRQGPRLIPYIKLGGRRFIRYHVDDLNQALAKWRVGGDKG